MFIHKEHTSGHLLVHVLILMVFIAQKKKEERKNDFTVLLWSSSQDFPKCFFPCLRT